MSFPKALKYGEKRRMRRYSVLIFNDRFFKISIFSQFKIDENSDVYRQINLSSLSNYIPNNVLGITSILL